ncbi:hypothetical protein Acsp06_51200 [Actinomycetospora sp. NBRC 106375]|uniref:hypothetical protein n=1 Tax=Actinomycetospora sp. NBRC 106375 TaxID=3032207 RepID=UPI0024A0CF3C|nr:hypothetical protein [Actinomycetospora sp. NBRC 106375]GLZ48935.1 hypothetical protein Acsp06_51200 [Actinomycetospora sp. NBRC 106375]
MGDRGPARSLRFRARDGDAVTAGRCHTGPTFVTEPPTVLTIATRQEIEDSLTRLAAGYRDARLVSARPALETATLLGDQYCEASVLWCHADGEGRRRVHSRYRYLLRRVHRRLATGSVAAYTRINTVTVLEGPRVAGPHGPR